MSEQLAPRNLASERVILGALVEDDTLLPGVISAGLDVDDLFLSDHRRIFSAMLELREKNEPLDYVTVAEQLGNSRADYVLLASLIDGVVVHSGHVRHHVRIVRKKARLRQLQGLGEWLLQSTSETSADPAALAHLALEKLEAVAKHGEDFSRVEIQL